jgi:adenylate cyclase
MLRQVRRNRPGIIGGVIAYLLFAMVQLVAPFELFSIIRERGFDEVLWADMHLRTPQAKAEVIVVDIDRDTLAALGNWPWPRATMAKLVSAVAAGKPDALGIDVLFAGQDPRASPPGSGGPDNTAAGIPPEALTDGDRRLAEAIGSLPTALGSTLDTVPNTTAPTVTVLRRGPIVLNDVWRGAGTNEPFGPLREAAGGNGIISLPGDVDGRVRRVPLLVGAGTSLRPGLAVEAVRLKQRASVLIAEAEPQRLVIGPVKIRLPRDGFLRLAPVASEQSLIRTIPAIDVMQNEATRAKLTGRIVLIGGSAPELGGLRETPGDPLTPSVQVEADAIGQILSQRGPVTAGIGIQFVLTLVLSAVALIAAVTASPTAGVAIAITTIGTLWIAAIALSFLSEHLIDPLTPTIGAATTFVTASLGSFVMVARREARIRDRFAQHLAPEVVRRIAENPEMLKLRAEKRELTALFTDIEGFTAMTHRAGPEQLVAELDGYIEGVATIVMNHGGMVDKIVGDAVHAFFNAPVDLANHPSRAVNCAIEIRDWTERYRSRASARLIGLGRTRIGIETGEAVVGDIGIRSKLDYTAHGDSINSAARLEAMNKELGSSICVGPTAAGYCDPAALRPLGTVALRGLEQPIAVFEPWPVHAGAEFRARYLAAASAIESDAIGAAEMFEKLSAEAPHDPVPAYMARRLRSQQSACPP